MLGFGKMILEIQNRFAHNFFHIFILIPPKIQILPFIIFLPHKAIFNPLRQSIILPLLLPQKYHLRINHCHLNQKIVLSQFMSQ